MDKCEAVLSDAKKCGFDTTLAMNIAVIHCYAAQGDTDNALKLLERCTISLAHMPGSPRGLTGKSC